MTEQLLREMPVHQFNQARGLSQQILTQLLDAQEPSITEIEKLADVYLSILRSHIQAMGGELEILAHFPHGTVRVSSFSDLESEAVYGSSRLI